MSRSWLRGMRRRAAAAALAMCLAAAAAAQAPQSLPSDFEMLQADPSGAGAGATTAAPASPAVLPAAPDAAKPEPEGLVDRQKSVFSATRLAECVREIGRLPAHLREGWRQTEEMGLLDFNVWSTTFLLGLPLVALILVAVPVAVAILRLALNRAARIQLRYLLRLVEKGGRPCVAERLGLLLFYVVRAAMPWAVALLALWILRDGLEILPSVTGPLARIALALGGLSALAAAVRRLFGRGGTEHRLAHVDEASAAFLRRWLLLTVELARMGLPFIIVLESLPGLTRTAELARVLFLLLMCAVVIAGLSRRRKFVNMVTEQRGRTEITLAFIETIRPIAMLYAATVAMLAVTGFAALSEYLSWRGAWSTLFVMTGIALSRAAAERLDMYANPPIAGGRPLDEEQRERRQLITRSAGWLAHGAVAVGCAAAILAAWGVTIGDLMGLLDYRLVERGEKSITFRNIVIACVPLFFAVIVSRWAGEILRGRSVPILAQLDRGLQHAIARGVHYGLLFLGLYMALDILGLDLGAMTVVLGTLGLSIGLGLQPIFINFICGIMILFERQVKVGDIVQISEGMGEVVNVGSRATVIRTYDNIDVVVPNSNFVTSNVINWTLNDRTIRLRLPVGVAYGSDVRLVERLLRQVAAEHPKVLHYPAPDVWFDEFGPNSLNFTLLVFIANAADNKRVRTDLNFAIDAAFRQHKVVIAFPQQTISFLPGPEGALRVLHLDARSTAPQDQPPPAPGKT